MKQPWTKKISTVFLLFFVPTFLMAQTVQKQVQSLSTQELRKIDPRFHGLIAEQIPSLRKPGMVTVAKPASVQTDGEKIYSAVITTDDPGALLNAGIRVNSVLPEFVTARFTASELVTIAGLEAVRYVDAGEIYYPKNDVATGLVGADLVQDGYVNNTNYRGSGVLVCIIDTGIDWEHKDFRDLVDDTQSRILYIWDQTLTKGAGEGTPEDRDGVNFAGLDYGVEYTNTHIEDEIDSTPAGFVREEDTHGHGTHVAGSAAGNGGALTTRKYAGIAYEADLVVVKAGEGSFPTSNTIDALTYAKKLSETMGQPIVVNMSLGGHANAHDGTRDLDQAVESFVGAGRVAVISAGNEGNDDIHITGTVTDGNTVNFQCVVSSYTPNSGSDNDYFGFDVWFDTGGSVWSQVTSPNSYTATQDAGTAGTTETNDGSIYLYNDVDAGNSDREVFLYVDDNDSTKTPAVGTWTLAVQNNSGGDMIYHGWLFTSSMGVTLTGGDSQYTVGSPGTATSALTVGSYVSRWWWSNYLGGTYWGGSPDRSDDISSFSSIGPRRDGVQKPDIAAPGEKVASSTSQDYTPSSSRILPGSKHHLTQGTSMSCPIVAGSVALLLEMNSYLTADQVKSLITSTAMTDSYTGGGLPDYTWGYGKLDIFRAMEKALDSGTDMTREILAYDGWTSTAAQGIGPAVQIGVKFTPTINCQVTGVLFHPYSPVDITGPLYFEIWSDDGGGLPLAKLGSTVSFDENEILPNSWNFVDMTGAGVSVTASTHYHAVTYFSSGTSIYFLMDNGSVDNRSSVNMGTWSAYGSGDFRLRPVVSSDEGVLLEAKIFLEGPYDSGSDEMTTTLNTSALIPTTSPYAEDARPVAAVPSDVTDWVLVELRSTPTGAAVVSKSVFLHKDGRIVADNGTSGTIALDVTPASYYVVVKHRNHLTVMSASAVGLSSGSSTLYDFTTGTAQYYGSDAMLLESSPSNVYGMYAGDGNDSDIVTNSDRDPIYANLNSSGYYDADTNCSGIVTNSDKDLVYSNLNKGSNVN